MNSLCAVSRLRRGVENREISVVKGKSGPAYRAAGSRRPLLLAGMRVVSMGKNHAKPRAQSRTEGSEHSRKDWKLSGRRFLDLNERRFVRVRK